MSRSVDHLVLAVRDLDAAVRTYRALGFTVGERNRHPWGTLNHIVQLDGSFLELIGLGPGFRPLDDGDPAAPFANGLARYLDKREGLAQVALQSHDAQIDAEAFAGPQATRKLLHFGRTAVAADGVRREVAFSLAFAPPEPGLEIEFFACQHHRPENFWAPTLQRHANTSQQLIGVVMAADEPRTRTDLLHMLFGRDAVTQTDFGVTAVAGPQTVEILRLDDVRRQYGFTPERPGFVAYRIAVGSLDATRSILDEACIPFDDINGALVVREPAAHGVTIGFETRVDSRETMP